MGDLFNKPSVQSTIEENFKRHLSIMSVTAKVENDYCWVHLRKICIKIYCWDNPFIK